MLQILKKFIRGEVSGWQKHEVFWLALCITLTCGISLFLKDTPVGIIASVTGTAYTVIAGKGKISCYIFGIINTVLYGLISMQNGLWGEVFLNWAWYLPMMFAGIICWKRRLNSKQTIIKTRLSSRGRIICAACSLSGVAAGAVILHHFNDPQPVIDSLTTVLSVTAMILTVKRCSEQWVMWTVVNTASIWMWIKAYLAGAGSIAVLLMWIIALANGIIFFIKWHRESEKCPEN